MVEEEVTHIKCNLKHESSTTDNPSENETNTKTQAMIVNSLNKVSTSCIGGMKGIENCFSRFGNSSYEQNENKGTFDSNYSCIKVNKIASVSSRKTTVPISHLIEIPDSCNVPKYIDDVSVNDVSDIENIPECTTLDELPGFNKQSKIKRSCKGNIRNVWKYSKSNYGVGTSKSKVKGSLCLSECRKEKSLGNIESFMEMSNTNSAKIVSTEARSTLHGEIVKMTNIVDYDVIGEHNDEDLFSDDASDVSIEYEYIFNDVIKHEPILKVKRKPSEISDALTERYKELTLIIANRKRIGRESQINVKTTHNLFNENWYEPVYRTTFFHDPRLGAGRRQYERPVFYSWPLFQQIREQLCSRAAYGYRSNQITNENQFFTGEIVKDSLLCHDKSRLSMAILGVCYIPEVCAEMLWKVGSWILQSNICGHPFLNTFQNMMRLLLYCDYLPEVVMDYVCSMLIKDNNVHEAYQVASAVISKNKFAPHIYFNIFYGNLEYVLWKLEWKRFNSSTVKEMWRNDWGNDDEDEESEEADDLKGNSQMAFHGQRAIQYFKKVEEEIGIWDLILPKYIEVLTYYEGKERAVEALLKHMGNNPNNPNSYGYYLHYVDESTKERDVLLKVLETYCAIDSTNDWGKELLILYKNSGRYCDLLALLTKRLDHQACRDSFFDWHLLNKLVAMRESKDIKEYFQENLSCYSSWAKYHFPVPLNNLNQNLSKRVLQLKSKIADSLNIDRFSDCVDAWLKSKNLKFKEDVVSDAPIAFNISLKCDLEPGNSFDEFDSLSSPEMIFCEEFDDDNDDADLDSTFTLGSSPERELPGVLIAPYHDFDRFEAVDESNYIEGDTTFEKKCKLISKDCPSTSSLYDDQGKKRKCTKNSGENKRKRKRKSTSSSSECDNKKPVVVQNCRVRIKRTCKSMYSVKPDCGKEKPNKAKKRRYKKQAKVIPAKKSKVYSRDDDWCPPTTIQEKQTLQVKLRERVKKNPV